MRRPYFVADAASVTVLHSVASSAFGKYSLTVPDGVNIDDVYKLSAPGNELGYVAQLAPAGKRVGGFARRFVRADVSVRSIGESNDDTWTAASDVDTTLLEAASRVQGDFFLESDITLAGLGPWVPFEHFDVGDIADVEIWGRVVPLPVTRIEPIVSEHSIVDWKIHVGGQLVSDDEARLAENDVVRRAVVDSRRDLAGLAETASRAVEAATTAKSTADDAKATAEATAALVEGLDLDSSIQQARDAVDASNKILELVRQFTGAAAAQGSQAQASAALALEYAQQAELILDELDPLRDDVVAAHAEVVRLSGEAAKAAQDAAAAVARGEQYMVAAQKSAGAAAQDAAKSQELVAQAQARLDELAPLQKQAADSLAEARAMLSDVDGSGKSLSDVLLDIAAKHQQVLSAHDEILTAHGEILEIHGEAIRYAAMAAAQASAAAMQASQAASEALRAADLNAQAIGKLAEADKKLAEADRKLQEQIDLLEQAQRLLIQAIRAVAAASSQAAAAAMSAGQAAAENANAITQTNIAVDAATDSLEALAKAQAAATQTANDAKTTAENAQKAQLDYQNTQKSIDALQASMLLRIQRFATGIVFALREERKRSVDHQIAFQMPGINRTMTFYADSVFDGWVYRLIIYSNGSVNAGSIPPGSWSENRNLDRSDWYAPVCASGSYKFVNFTIPVGDVAAAMVFVTKNTWQ